MDWDFGLFEKTKEIYEACRRYVWYAVPIVGFFAFVKWFLFEWLPSRAWDVLEKVQAMLPKTIVDFADVDIDWSRINQWVPVSEAVAYGTAYITLGMFLVMLRWLKKLLPFG